MADIDVWKIRTYGNMVYHQSQQKGSIFEQYCKPETFGGVSKFFDIIGTTEAIDRSSRTPSTPNLELSPNKRMLTIAQKHWGTITDDIDKLQMIADPDSEYLKAAIMGFGRTKDKMFVDSFIAPAYEDRDGGTTVAFPDAQKRAAVASSALTNLNIATILDVKQQLDEADLDPELPRYWAVTPGIIKGLLKITEVTNSDYNTVKALAEGKIDTYAGFKFIVSNRLKKGAVTGFSMFNTDGTYKGSSGLNTGTDSALSYVWAGNDTIYRGMNPDMKTEVGPRADLSYSNQIYIQMGLGFMRIEDVKCMTVACKQV